MSFDKIVECVPNFSEGRNGKVIEKIADAFRVDGVKLLDYSAFSVLIQAATAAFTLPKAETVFFCDSV